MNTKESMAQYARTFGRVCQSCQAEGPLDYHHKARRWKSGDEPSEGLALCRKCHTFLHSKRKWEDEARGSSVSMESGGFLDWSLDARRDYSRMWGG